MSETNKPYKCVYCGRRFSKPTGHKCKGGFRKRHLAFEYIPPVEDLKHLQESVKEFFDELDRVVSDHEKSAKERHFSEPTQTYRIISQDEFSDKICPDEHDVHGIASPLDTQVGGDHYKKYKIQPIEFAMANNLNACQTNILKYIMRYKDKDGKKDLEKARHYIDILIQTEYPNE